MASNGETGALLLAASACVHVDVCVCVGGTGCLAVRGERADRPGRRRGAQRGERVWVPKYYRLETGRQSNPSIFNASVGVSTYAVQFCLFVCFTQCQILTDHQFKITL